MSRDDPRSQHAAKPSRRLRPTDDSAKTSTPRSIQVNIERLVLHGFPAKNRLAAGRALERELGRLLAEHGAPPALLNASRIETLDVGTIALTNETNPERIGTQIARSLYDGFRGRA